MLENRKIKNLISDYLSMKVYKISVYKTFSDNLTFFSQTQKSEINQNVRLNTTVNDELGQIPKLPPPDYLFLSKYNYIHVII